MANGLLPINGSFQQQQGQGQQGYSQVSPMFGMYYNASQAPGGNQVLGYNMNNGMMPYAGAAQHMGAVPAAPIGGSMSAGQVTLGNSGSNGYSAATTQPATSYGAATGSNANSSNSAYSPASVAANKQSQSPPVAAQPQNTAAAAPKYSQTGPLAQPNSVPIHANASGQMQGSTAMQPRMQPQAQSQTQMPVNYQALVNHVAQQAAAKKPPPKPAPKPQNPLDKWLAGDTTYQQQLAEFNQEQNAYNTNSTNTADQISQNFNATQRSMNNQAALDRMNQQYDFAGRGVLSSGAYAQALDQYNTQFQNNMGNLVQGENQQNTANSTNLNNFLRQLVLQRDAAKQDAISRRAAQLGITG